jgi:GNAT superfamily N-acetyltransferase
MTMLKIYSTKEYQLKQFEKKQLHQVMVKGYELTEEEIWGKNYVRLFYPEFEKLINAGTVYVALLNNQVVGCVNVYPKNNNTYGFGLLAVDINYTGQGIGTSLINKAEEVAKKNGATYMKIEILRIKSKEIPHKVILANYYKRLGYEYTHSEDCSCLIPEWKYKLLVEPSNFDFYKKKLI